MKSRPRRRKGLEAKESVRASPSGSRSRVLVFVLLMGLAVLAYRSFQRRSIPVEAIRQAARGDGSFTDVTLQAHLGDDRFSQGVSPEKTHKVAEFPVSQPAAGLGIVVADFERPWKIAMATVGSICL